MNFGVKTVTWDGSATSDAIDLGGGTLIAILPDSDFSGAAITFTASMDDENYYEVDDETGTQISYTVATGIYTVLPSTLTIGLDQIKIISDGSETATALILIK